jgi:3-oxoacyl-[acyl-carrier protein] reductase
MDTERHVGKVILITGAASGIGRATAIRFAHEGANCIYLVDRLAQELKDAADEITSLGIKAVPIEANLDLSENSIRAVDTAHNSAGRLDVIIANAAIVKRESFLELPLRSWEEIFAVNVTAPFVLAQRAAQYLVSDGLPGVILFTGSVAGLGGGSDFTHYNASKAALTNVMKSASLALADYGIRVNSVTVGPSDTAFADDVVGIEAMNRLRTEGFPDVPLGRLCSAEDVAAAFSFLASDDASYLTGTELIIDGGLSSRVYTVPRGDVSASRE